MKDDSSFEDENDFDSEAVIKASLTYLKTPKNTPFSNTGIKVKTHIGSEERKGKSIKSKLASIPNKSRMAKNLTGKTTQGMTESKVQA